jgi:GMP synthase-like glutamine amidotransferase
VNDDIRTFAAERMPVRALFVQHDHVSPTGPVSERLRERGFEVDEVLIVDADHADNPNVEFEFPSTEDYDLVVPMGAPWGAWDDQGIGRWLVPEIAWLRAALDADVPVLGICFGGQLMSRALGGAVATARRPEIGWASLHSDDPDVVPPGPWFEFHYDNWTVPAGAREIARTASASQAFTFGRSLAVQFHPELTADSLEGWLRAGGAEKVAHDGQDADALLAHTRAEEPAARRRTAALVDSYLERIARLLPAP